MSKQRIITIAITLSSLFSYVFYAPVAYADFRGSGFGDARMNDCFVSSGVTPDDGSQVWANPTNTYFIVVSAIDGYYRSSDLSLDIDPYYGPPPTVEYYKAPGGDLTTGTWLVNTGTSPAGTFIFDLCPPPTPPTPVATSSETAVFPGHEASTSYQIIDNPNQDYFNGLLAFMAGVVIIIWIFKGRK